MKPISLSIFVYRPYIQLMKQEHKPFDVHALLTTNSPPSLIAILKQQIVKRVNIEHQLIGLGCRLDVEYKLQCLQPYAALCQLADPNTLSSYDLLSFFCMYDQKEEQSHKQWTRQMLAGNPNNAGLLWVLANLQFNTFQFKEALDNYYLCWKSVPYHPKVSQIILWGERYHASANLTFFKIEESNLQQIDLSRVRKASQSQTSEEYEQLLLKVVQVDPHNIRAWVILGRMSCKDQMKRVQILKKGLPYQSFSCVLHFELGEAYYQLKQFTQANYHFEVFLNGQKYFNEEQVYFAYYYLFQIARISGDEPMMSHYEALRISTDPLMLYWRGLMYSKLFNFERAVLLWSHMQQLGYNCPKPEYWYERGFSQSKLQNYENAVFYFRQSVEKYHNKRSIDGLDFSLVMLAKKQKMATSMKN